MSTAVKPVIEIPVANTDASEGHPRDPRPSSVADPAPQRRD
jgi:hypothetical protein